MSAFPGVSSYQSSSPGSKFVVIGVVCCQEMRRNALFHKVLPVLTKYLVETTIQILGRNAQLYESTDDNIGSVIVWQNETGTVLFYITGCVSTEELVKMAESIGQI